MIYRMTHATIYVSDIGEAVDFYRDKLGVTGIRTAEEFPDYVELPTEGATIALVRPAEGSAGEGQAGGRVTGLTLTVPNLRTLHEELLGKGVMFTQPIG